MTQKLSHSTTVTGATTASRKTKMDIFLLIQGNTQIRPRYGTNNLDNISSTIIFPSRCSMTWAAVCWTMPGRGSMPRSSLTARRAVGRVTQCLGTASIRWEPIRGQYSSHKITRSEWTNQRLGVNQAFCYRGLFHYLQRLCLKTSRQRKQQVSAKWKILEATCLL